jgi:hypothetical protein
MNSDQNRIGRAFLSNLDTIATDLVHRFGLKHEQKTETLNDSLLRWLDFRLRYIDPKPRKVFLSNKFRKEKSQDFSHALGYMIDLIQRGQNLNPYQGEGLILHDDISGRKRQKRTDLLWADWGIIHLHLTEAPISETRYFSKRSDWLLFGIPGDDFFAVIDVRHHDFSNPELMKIMVESWPEMMERFEVKGIAPQDEADVLDPKEHARLRKSGVSALMTIGGKVYMGPGIGISTASTPLRVTRKMDTARKYVRQLVSDVCMSDGRFQAELHADGIEDPCLSLCMTPRGMAVYELHSDKAWLLPRKKACSESNYLADLHDLVAPEWATERLFASGQDAVCH